VFCSSVVTITNKSAHVNLWHLQPLKPGIILNNWIKLSVGLMTRSGHKSRVEYLIGQTNQNSSELDKLTPRLSVTFIATPNPALPSPPLPPPLPYSSQATNHMERLTAEP